MPKVKTSFEMLPIIPCIVAETVCSTVYTGSEVSDTHRDSKRVAQIESKRQLMTPAQVREFSDLTDVRCKRAYELDVPWFKRCLKGNKGRDLLYMWVTHWLSSYLMNPTEYVQRMKYNA